jgi:hypothetical protein
MEFIQVCDKVLSSGRSKFLFRMNRKVWVVAFVGKKKGNTSSGMQSIVIDEFCKW